MPEGFTYHRELLRAFTTWADRREIMAVFTSTNSELEALAPSARDLRSSRAYSNREHLLAPIVEFPFDFSPAFPLKKSDVDRLMLSDITSLQFITQFGRPL